MRCSEYWLRLLIAVFASLGVWEASAEDQKKQTFYMAAGTFAFRADFHHR